MRALISIERTMEFMNQCRAQCDIDVLGFFLNRSDSGSVFESPKADFVDLSTSSPIFRGHCALPCC
jgi:hypothetical protein